MASEANEIKTEIRLVAFIDILGFSAAVKKRQNIKSLVQLLDLFKKQTRNFFDKETKKGSDGAIRSEMTPAITTFSDSIIISYPLTSEILKAVPLFLFSSAIPFFALRALEKGFLLRGAISAGNVYHQNEIFVGQVFNDAFKLEKEAKMPRILIKKELKKELNIDNLFVESYDEHSYSLAYIREMICYHTRSNNLSSINESIKKLDYLISENIKKLRADETLEDSKRIIQKWNWYQAKFKRIAEKLTNHRD